MSEGSEARRATKAGEGGALLLAAGGLAAAFGAASCCALPMLLSAIGVGSAGLAGIALLAAPYQGRLLLAAAACVLVGGGLLWRSRAAACSPSTVCARPGLRRVTTLTLTVAAILALLGYAIA
ncbi:MAG TPA: mercuric transporter MerT family protein [Stellaceae bacterium]|nr:mercuric transporter MerT family protein [Stellaceae bacterium]